MTFSILHIIKRLFHNIFQFDSIKLVDAILNFNFSPIIIDISKWTSFRI